MVRLSQDADRKFCRLCGQALQPFTGPQGLAWMRCPRWPKRGPHWWSGETAIEHDYVAWDHSLFDLPFDPVTGLRR